MFAYLEKLSQRQICIGAVGLSFLFSILNYGLFPSVGTDGILYLRCAAAYDQSGLKAAMALYPWPFYSIMIAYIHQLGLSYANAGRLLDALLQAWMIFFFLRIIFHFRAASARIGFWALLCILCYSTFNAERSILLRDFGYWAFYLTSLWSLLEFLKTEKQGYLGLFGFSILIAILFRVEGVIIAAASIMLIFFMPGQSFSNRIRNGFLMAWPFWLGAALFLVIGSHHLYGGGRLQEIYHYITDGATVLLHNKTQAITLMNKALNPYYPFISTSKMYFSMLVGYFIYKIILTTGIGYSMLAVYGWVKKALTLTSKEKILLYGLMIVQIIMLVIFLINNLFLTVRYVLALSLLILLWVPFGLEQIYQKTMALTQRRCRVSMIIVLGAFFIFSLLYSEVHIGASKQYVSDAAQWLEQRVGVNDRILVNDPGVLYWVKGAISTWDEDLKHLEDETDCQFSTYRYVAIKFRHQRNPLEHCSNITLLQSYHNERGDTVNIYSVNRP